MEVLGSNLPPDGLLTFCEGPCSNRECVCITFADILPLPRPLPLSPESLPLPL